MIRRLYVDNFRSLVDFTWEPGKECLVLGYNGSGKTSALEIIQILREWAMGERPLGVLLSSSDWTTWREGSDVKIELDVEATGTIYSYRVTFALTEERSRYVKHEELIVNGTTAFRRNERYVLLRPDSDVRVPEFPINRTLSFLSVVGDAPFGIEPASLREVLSTMVHVKPDPRTMMATWKNPAEVPERSLENLSGWLLYLLKDQDFDDALTEFLKDVWPELVLVHHLEVTRDLNLLTFSFGPVGNGMLPILLTFDELSDGERMLVALYTLAAFQKTRASTTLFVDEPDNYVSVRELQPWLLTMLDDRPDEGQIILVSHNPEIIQTMGRSRVDYFSREDHLSPTRVSKLPSDETGLPLTELLARGWVDV